MTWQPQVPTPSLPASCFQKHDQIRYGWHRQTSSLADYKAREVATFLPSCSSIRFEPHSLSAITGAMMGMGIAASIINKTARDAPCN
eukprot:364861-Chlamydomonas_euryale.AAC.24